MVDTNSEKSFMVRCSLLITLCTVRLLSLSFYVAGMICITWLIIKAFIGVFDYSFHEILASSYPSLIKTFLAGIHYATHPYLSFVVFILIFLVGYASEHILVGAGIDSRISCSVDSFKRRVRT